MSSHDTSRISPTAHYTGYVWFTHHLSHPALVNPQGRALYEILKPFNSAYEALTPGPSLRQMLLQRHRVIDHLLSEAVQSGEVGQIVEIAAGMSPRGYRFSERFGAEGLVYVEADLPAMARAKHARLDQAGLLGARHHVVSVNALVDSGPESLDAVGARWLDPSKGTAVITEGLINYFDTPSVEAIWGRIARFLSQYPRGLYVSDMHTNADISGSAFAHAFRAVLSVFARGAVHLHYDGPAQAREALAAAGFKLPLVHAARDFGGALKLPAADGAERVRVVEAWV